MSGLRSFERFASATHQWRDLAERRLAHLVELHCSGRWRHYYSEDRLHAHLQEAARAVELWADIVSNLPEIRGPATPPHEPGRRAAA
jgi:uncharacterized repeat protein (TIGR03809 family)